MPLIDLKTNLKSLKFGKDRPGGGSSNQPYIKSKLPDQDSDRSNIFNTGGPDSLLRGGVLAPLRAAEDTSRLTQMFFDLKSPTGLLFTSNQNLLSRLSVHTEASSGPGYGAGKVNQGIYTPLNTIGQAGVNLSGTHLNHFGLDPSSPIAGVAGNGIFPSLGLNRYEEVVDRKNKDGNNRLEGYYKDYISSKNTDPYFPATPGGPGSILGIGETKIPLSKQRTGLNNPLLGVNNKTPNPTDDFITPTGSISYDNLLDGFPQSNIQAGSTTWLNLDSQTVYKSGSLNTNPDNQTQLGWNDTTTWTQEDINSLSSEELFRTTGQIQDFREKLDPPTTKKVLGKLANGYDQKIRMENRVHVGDPGKPKNVIKYGTGYNGEALDKITASGIIKRSAPRHSKSEELNDLVKFSIGVIENNSEGQSNFMHFRAFIDGFSDQYSADWGNTQYVGRADKFYHYKGFDRTIDLSFTVAAQSKAELIPMYRKLNYLASSLAPSYSEGGFMQGNLIRLTMGGYLYNQVGILKGLTYTIPQESPWEIAIDDDGGFDSSVNELPHIIKVTGFSFIPIQDFVPRVANPNNQNPTRYISLSRGNGKTNY